MSFQSATKFSASETTEPTSGKPFSLQTSRLCMHKNTVRGTRYSNFPFPLKTQASSSLTGGRAVYMDIAICEWGPEMGHYITKKGEKADALRNVSLTLVW